MGYSKTLDLMLPAKQANDRMTEQLDFVSLYLKQNLANESLELQRLIYARVVKTQKMVEPVVLTLWKSKDQELVGKLRDPNPLIRWFAADFLSRRQVHAEKELISLLKDPFVEVRNAGHQALVRLGRGTDFGPPAKPTTLQIRDAIALWTAWVDMQDPITPSLSPSESRNSDLEPFQLIEKKKSPKKEKVP